MVFFRKLLDILNVLDTVIRPLVCVITLLYVELNQQEEPDMF